jgi:hypothetical protein
MRLTGFWDDETMLSDFIVPVLRQGKSSLLATTTPGYDTGKLKIDDLLETTIPGTKIPVFRVVHIDTTCAQCSKLGIEAMMRCNCEAYRYAVVCFIIDTPQNVF